MCYRLTSRIYSIDIGVSLEISFDLLRNESVQEQSKSRLSRSIFAGNSAKTALRDLCSNSSELLFSFTIAERNRIDIYSLLRHRLFLRSKPLEFEFENQNPGKGYVE